MYFEILDNDRLTLLQTLCDKIDLSAFYLVGGTALSLQMKLRKSYDFDFFSQSPFNENKLYDSILQLFPNDTKVIQLTNGTCNLVIKDVRTSFFEYPYPLVNQTHSAFPIEKLYMADIEDIAAMKMSAIGGRGAKKDFFDLYHIFTRTDLSAEKLIQLLKKKFGNNFNFSYMLMGLDYFDDAEDEVLPELFVDFDWNKTKKYFVQKKKELMECAFSELN